MLQVKLAPEIARQFGKQATGDVRKAGGRLSNTEFSGEDTAPVLTQATRNKSDLETRISDIQKQLANRSLKDAERAQLQSQLDQLRSQLSENQSAVEATQERLANTPMTFNYYGKGGILGFAGRNPVMDAARSFVSSLVTMISVVLQALAFLLPWVLLLILIILLVRWRPVRAAGRFLFPRSGPDSDETP
jgi:Flp pilus assembly protein TadB